MVASARKSYLTALDIPLFVARDQVCATAELPEPVPDILPVIDLPIAVESLAQLSDRAASCTACGLAASRTKVVFGSGNEQAALMIIGEAPGADEDRQGLPFVGAAGQLLTAILSALGLQREQVYIANILKCKTPANRDPHKDEITACDKLLQQQINLIQPKVILSLGGISAHHLLNTDEAVGRLRKRQHVLTGDGFKIPLLVTYHPAYLLRRTEEKAKVWQDLQQLQSFLA